VIILDGAALVNMLKPVGCKIFDDYAAKVFLPYIGKQLERADRVDIVWNQYLQNSWKSETRKCRRKGSNTGWNGTLAYLATGSSFSYSMQTSRNCLHFWLDTRRERRT